jgi:alpha-methylacyl-CoA racemase
MHSSDGPLSGVRVIEFAGIGPGPHCAMLLADLGAEVLRIDRAGGNGWPNPVVDRARSVLTVDIRSPAGRDRCAALAARADVLIEGFRPGVMERLGLGPEPLQSLNPRLVYARMTGWGQTGPKARVAGHDINFIALAGALAAIGEPGRRSVPPLNLVGDFGGGSLFLAFGILAALLERAQSGKGQVIDGAVVDGVASLMTMFSGMIPSGKLSVERAENLLGGAAPFYRTYRCADGGEVAVGPLEPAFYRELLEAIGAPARLADTQYDRASWDEQTRVLAEIFLSRTRDEWSALLDSTDACAAPVLSLDEVPLDPHMQVRGVYQRVDGLWHAAPAPRFSRTPGRIRDGEDPQSLIDRWLGRDGLQTR